VGASDAAECLAEPRDKIHEEIVAFSDRER